MPDKCEHRRVRRMTWPDNGDSELCTDCLLTRHHWEQGDSGWQDHGYKSPADWYREAAEFEDSMTENIEQDKNTDSVSGVGADRVVMNKRQQVLEQHRAVAALARGVIEITEGKIPAIEGGHMDELLDMLGNRSARWMEDFGDLLNGCDAVTEDDDWMEPIFLKAQEMFPQAHRADL